MEEQESAKKRNAELVSTFGEKQRQFGDMKSLFLKNQAKSAQRKQADEDEDLSSDNLDTIHSKLTVSEGNQTWDTSSSSSSMTETESENISVSASIQKKVRPAGLIIVNQGKKGKDIDQEEQEAIQRGEKLRQILEKERVIVFPRTKMEPWDHIPRF